MLFLLEQRGVRRLDHLRERGARLKAHCLGLAKVHGHDGSIDGFRVEAQQRCGVDLQPLADLAEVREIRKVAVLDPGQGGWGDPMAAAVALKPAFPRFCEISDPSDSSEVDVGMDISPSWILSV